MASFAAYVAARNPDAVSDPLLPALESQAREETGGELDDCGLTEKAVFLLAMHWWSLLKRDPGGLGINGQLKKEKEDRLEREYLIDFSLTARYPDLSQTRWGLELIRLRKSCIIGFRNRLTVP